MFCNSIMLFFHLKKITISDIFTFLGLAQVGAGLFFLAGIGVSMTICGAIMLCMGFFGRN